MTQVIAIVLGGLGGSQMGDVVKALQTISEVMAFSPGGIDECKTAVAPIAAAFPTLHVALIGHSLACDTVNDAAKALDAAGLKVAYLCMIEPVWQKKILAPCDAYDVFRCDSWIDFPKADVEGANVEIVSGTDHNSICHTQYVLDRIVFRVKSLAVPPPASGDDAARTAATAGSEYAPPAPKLVAATDGDGAGVLPGGA